MSGAYRLALTGDVIMNTRVSTSRDPNVLAAVEVLRTADVTHAHLEIPLHDFDDAGIFGAAEGALAWYRGPTAIAEELRWLGVELVSTASNHSLDYSYGGLRSTCAALDAAGLAHAGAGPDLAAARAPAFADTAAGRIALVSATSSFPAFARAGPARTDAAGRPGVNPLRYLHVEGISDCPVCHGRVDRDRDGRRIQHDGVRAVIIEANRAAPARAGWRDVPECSALIVGADRVPTISPI